MEGTFKISGAGWLCILVDGKWRPSFKLTEAQIQDVQATLTPAPGQSPEALGAWLDVFSNIPKG